MPSEKDHQSEMTRREALRVLGAASALPLFHPAHLAHSASSRADVGAAWHPRFLDPKDVDTVASLSNCIVPDARTRGARAQAVHEYMDLALSRSELAVQTSFNEGLRWLGTYVARSTQRDVMFSELSREQQHQLLAEISDTSQAHEPQGYAFFTQVKQLTIEGYYRS